MYQSEWNMVELRRRNRLKEVWQNRLYLEASSDRVSFRTSLLRVVSAWLIAAGEKIKACCKEKPESPHHYITSPQDRVFE